MKFEDLNFKIGSVNPSGVATISYYVPKSGIKSWPVIDDNPEEEDATVEGIANYVGDFVLHPGINFARIYSTFGKGKVTFEVVGEADCKMYMNKTTLSFPKITDEGRAFAKATANGDFVFITKHDGKFFITGHPDYPCTVATAGDTGDTAGSTKGLTFNLECPDTTPMPKYVGDILLSDGTLDTTTGIFTPTVAA